MPKKTIYWLCGLLVLGALGFYGFTKWQETRSKVDLWTIVPDDAVFIVETNNAPRFVEHLQQTDLWGTVSRMPYVLRLEDQLLLLDTLTAGRVQLKKFLTNKNVLVSMHVLGRSDYDFIYYVPVKTVGEHRYIRTLVENLGRNPEFIQETREYQGFQVTDISHRDNKENLSYFSYHNNLIISPSPVLIEEIVRKINRGQLESPAKDYQNTNYMSQKDVYANVFINYQHLPDMLGVFLRKDLQGDINLISSLCRSSLLGLKLDNNRLFLNGFSVPETVEGALYSRLKGHAPKSFKMKDFLPSSAAVVLHMGLDKMGALKGGPGKDGPSFVDTLANSFSGELGLCYLESYDTKTATEKVLFAQSSNPAYTSALLNRLQPGRTNGTEERHGNNVIRLLTTRELPEQLFGELFRGFEQVYYTTLKDYVLFTDDVQTMRTLLKEVEAGKVWSKSEALQPMLEQTQQENNVGIYINTANAWNLLMRGMSTEKQTALVRNSSIIKKFNHFSFQFSAKGERYYTSLLVRHQEESSVKAVLASAGFRQEDVFTLKSQLVTSAFLTQYPVDRSDEVVVQDAAFVVHGLGTQAGKQNWTDTLENPIIGQVQQLTYGSDKRLKYLFATSNRIYCVDKSGKDVGSFPFTLGDTLKLQHLTAFDYNKNNDYRLAADDNLGNIYLLDMQGNLQTGWSPMRLDGRLAAPPQHHKVNGRDVILVVLENGFVYAFTSQGETYPGFPLNLEKNLRSTVYAKPGISFRRSLFTTVTQDGQVITFDLTGEVAKREQLLRTDRRSTFELIPEVGGKSFVIARTDPGRVALYSQDLKLLLDRRFVTSSRKVIQYFHFGGDRKLYVISETGPRKAYLYDVQAQPLGQEPINASMPVTVRYNEVQNQYTVFATYENVVQKIIVQGRD